ncbi:MAG: sulfite exporter TauE/SafE family protein [Pseudomonadota bacterium]
MSDLVAFELSASVFIIIALVSMIGSAATAAFSIGGGLLLIGVMSVLVPPAAVIPVHGVIMVGSNAGRSALLLQHVRWDIIVWFAIGALIGGLIGAQVVFGLPSNVLRLCIAGFIMFTQWGPKIALPLGAPFYAVAGSLSMFLTLFVGASGPFITAILSRLPQLSRMALIATSGGCMTLQHSGKVAIFGLGGFDYTQWAGLIGVAIVAGFVGTVFGTRLLKRIDEEAFRSALRWILTALALWLVFLGITSE